MQVDVSALKVWLNDSLKQLAISDPLPLSQYIIALIKKNKPENELIKSCNEQLQIFLQDHTADFVERLFSVLRSDVFKDAKVNYRHSKSMQGRNSSPPDSPKRRRQSRSRSSSSDSISNRRRNTKRSYIRRDDSPHHVKHSRLSPPPAPRRSQEPISTLVSPNNKQSVNCLLGRPPLPMGGFAMQNDYFGKGSLWSEGVSNSMDSCLPTRSGRRNYSPPKNIISLISPKESNSYEPEQLNSDTNGIEYQPSPINQVQTDSPKCILLTRIPAELNDLRKLLDHFSQFGQVINVHTHFQGSECKAMIEFKTDMEASAALNSPEPVFSNRFIRVSPWFKGGSRSTNVRSRLNLARKQPPFRDNSQHASAPAKSRFRLERGSGSISDQENSEEDQQIVVTEREQQKALEWEQQKLIALQEHRQRAAEMQKRKEATNSRLTQLQNALRAVLTECQVLSQQSVSNDETKKARLNDLLGKASTLQVELKTVQAEMGGAVKKPEDVKGTVASVLTNVLDPSTAADRLSKVQQVKHRISQIQKQVSELRASEETVPQELCKELLELKRQLVSLETITSQDLKNAKMTQSTWHKTKLDKRPRTVYIIGLNSCEIDDFVQKIGSMYLHMESHVRHQFTGETEVNGLEPDATLLEVTFRTRDFAETAIRTLRNYRNRTLIMTFQLPVPLNQLSQVDAANTVVDVAVTQMV